MTPEEKAEQIVAKNFPTLWATGLIHVIATAIREARNEALEEAAGVAETCITGTSNIHVHESRGAQIAANRILALKDKPKGEI
jgi:hypothetical protein